MPKVYVVNDMNHNFDKATRFGTLVYLTEGKVPFFKTDITRNMLKEKLKNFTVEDYILVSGPALLCIMAAFIAAEYLNTVKFLVFDAKEHDYVVRHISTFS